MSFTGAPSAFQDMTLFHKPTLLKTTRVNVARQLVHVVTAIEHDEELRNGSKHRTDWARLNGMLQLVRPQIEKYLEKHKVSAKSLTQCPTPNPPKGVLSFPTDGVIWQGRMYVIDIDGVVTLWICIPTDGFLLTPPSVSGVKKVGESNNGHYSYPTVYTPPKLKMNPADVAEKLPTIGTILKKFRGDVGFVKENLEICQCVEEQRIDIDFLFDDGVGLHIQFEVGLPSRKIQPTPRAQTEEEKEAIEAAFRLWT